MRSRRDAFQSISVVMETKTNASRVQHSSEKRSKTDWKSKMEKEQEKQLCKFGGIRKWYFF